MLIVISVNGESREVPENLTLEALLAFLSLPADRVAVERNLEIVPRRRWAETNIQPGDRLEVVHFVGGGLCCSNRRGCGPPACGRNIPLTFLTRERFLSLN